MAEACRADLAWNVIHFFLYLAQLPLSPPPYPIGVKLFPGYTPLNFSSPVISEVALIKELSITAV